ncbi:related to protein kinase [Rhynchosporium graminicola]|uniref:Related to protein kinase n=1 Tax=Rhynchosporium graminicola TaxID=2792576 RepID=A0A1E1JXG7_9HELO|nr:related to protein kinase [Rhynchosporium commune]
MSDSSSVTSDRGTLEEIRDNGLMAVGMPKGLEKIYDYESGGHHPVHLGELLDGRYKFIHKLGSGGYANVWLCSDDTNLRPANILTRITGLDGLSEDQVFEALGSPVTTKVTALNGDPHDEITAPQYLVYPICWDDVELTTLGAEFISEQACIIDFGESFDVTNPPEDVGIPQVYCSPEYTLDRIVDIGCDIWSLGCTIFEIRTGQKSFDTFDDDQDEYLWKMTMILGKLPEPWWSQTWIARKTIFEDNTDAEGRVVEVPQQLRPSEDGKPEIERTIVQVAEPRSIKEAIARGLFYYNRNGPGGVHLEIPELEVELLADLLAKVLKYDPNERLTARQISEHAWFKM